jgi:DNA mismatch repair protein MutS2
MGMPGGGECIEGFFRGTIAAMDSRFAPGDAVQTPLGKGTVREVRRNGSLLVEIRQRMLVLAEREVAPLASARRPDRRPASPPDAGAATASRHDAIPDVDLHGLSVDAALQRIDDALNEALLAGAAEIRFIHGRSGGRLRGALHQRLRAVSSVRGFRIDPRNAGVTIVTL